MAQALSSSFDEWIRSLLSELQSNDVDMSDFVEYLMGIITSDTETNEEKQIAIAELLADLDLKHNHNIDNLSQQIFDRWYKSENDKNDHANSIKSRLEKDEDDDVMSTALINAMNQMESSSKQKQQNSNKFNDDAELKKHKSQVLAKYSEVSEEELDYEDEIGTSDSVMFHNTNTQDVEDREKKAKDVLHEAYKKQVDKNKVDINTQKQKDEERKKKAQQRAQKQERRR